MSKISREALLNIALEADRYRDECGFLECDFDALGRFAELVLAAQQPIVKESLTAQEVLTAGEIDALGLGVFGVEYAEIVAAEREACAKVCERRAGIIDSDRRAALISAAMAIRARGEK